jgi:hypothetical protein
LEEFISASFGRNKKIDSLHSRPNCGGAKSLKLTLHSRASSQKGS